MNKLATIQPAPDIARAIDLAPLADSTKAQYTKAIGNALAAGVDLTNPEALATYAAPLGQSSKMFLKAALKLWAATIERTAKGSATPDNVNAVLATTYRLEALNEAITVKSQNGTKAHFWLSQADVKKLLRTCDDSLKGQRDKIILGILVGAGLRRLELATLDFSAIKHQPVKGKFRTVLDVTGKGDKARVIPLSDSLAAALDAWHTPTKGAGRVARSVTKGGRLGDSLSPIGIFNIVNQAGTAIGYPDLAPHDLRRTYAQIGYEAGIPVTQISKLLGHASIATTQRYLNLELDLETTVSDFVPFE